MDERTLTALKRSIAKWEKRVELGVAYSGPTNGTDCPLCQVFASAEAKTLCEGCPVAERTGRPDCEGTPYYDWRHAYWAAKDHAPDAELSARVHVLAQAELDFLKSLLPAQVIEAGGQDAKRLGAQHESPVAEGEAP